MKKVLNLFFMLAFLVGLMTNCTKTAEEPQPIDQLVGVWNMSQTCTVGSQSATATNTLAITKNSFPNSAKMTYGSVTFDVNLNGKDFSGTYSYTSQAGFTIVEVKGRLVDAKNLEFTQGITIAARNVGNCIVTAKK